MQKHAKNMVSNARYRPISEIFGKFGDRDYKVTLSYWVVGASLDPAHTELDVIGTV